MTTLRDLWIAKGMSSTQVAAAANISVPTLYRMNRKEAAVLQKTINDVCRVLGISRAEYERLSPCPQAERWR